MLFVGFQKIYMQLSIWLGAIVGAILAWIFRDIVPISPTIGYIAILP